MCFSIGVLSLLTIFMGYLNEDLFVGLSNSVWFGVFSYTNDYLFFNVFKESVGFFFRVFFSFLFFVFFIFFFFFYNDYFFFNIVDYKSFIFIKKCFDFFFEKWWFSNLYKFFVDYFFRVSYNYIFLLLDRGVFERLGPFGVVRLFYVLLESPLFLKRDRVFYYFIVFSFLLFLLFFNFEFGFFSICVLLLYFQFLLIEVFINEKK